MKIVTNFEDLQFALQDLRRPLGFVPTMGYLHEGHLSLVRKARNENESTVVSIFTNPTQFAPEEDLGNYPTDIDRDQKHLRAEKVDLVWIPPVDLMYHENFQTWVSVKNLGRLLEGKYRPTHFQGVTTIVSKLFNAVQPERAYFGQKDAQQARIIQQMVSDLNYPIEIIVCPIVREGDGLALSSRNSYLGENERIAAVCLSRGLFKARDAFAGGEKNVGKLKEIVLREINQEGLANVQYVSCAHPISLEELSGNNESCLISLAVFIGKTRLIDNIILPESNGLPFLVR